MADSEDIGGISVSLGANDTKLVSDLAQAERLAQQWATQHFEVTVGARFTGGAGAPGGAGGGDLTQLTKAIEQAIANGNARPAARPQQAVAPRVVAPGVASTAAAGAGSNLQRAINAQLAKSGEVYNELTGEIEKTTTAHRAQRTAVDAATRSVRQEAQAPAPTVDTGALQTEIKSLVAVLAEFRAALATAAEGAATAAKAPAAARATAVAPTSPGYHAGDLGYGKDTTLGRMTPGRGTGHFGTGSYFVSDPSKITGRGDRPVQSADFAGRNLYTPKTKAAALQLHDALKLANDENAEAAQKALQKIFPQIADTAVSEAVTSAKADIGKTGYVESISTRIMRKLGYEGVDVRHLPDLDNTQFGSVIYGQSAAPSAGGGGRKGRRGGTRTAAPPPGGDEDEEEGGQPTQTLFAATEQFRRQHAGRDPLGLRQRPALRAKRTAQDVHYQRQQRAEEQSRLQALIDQNAAAGGNVRTSASFAGGSASAPPTPVGRTQQNETPEERQRRERDERDQRVANEANTPTRNRPLRARSAAINEANAVRAAQQRQEQLFISQRAGVVSPEEREARIQESIEKGRANVTAATSTGRTSASRLGSTFLGTGGRRLEADTRAAEARRELNAANRAALPFERELATINEDIAASTPTVARGLRAQRDAFVADPKVAAAFKRQEEAIRGVANATREYEKLQSGGNIVRNLGAIALGSFAFSAALKAVDLAVSSVTPVIADFIDLQTGYAAKSTAVTTALAKQTAEQRGNVNAVIAQAAVTAGLTQESADYLSTQLKLTTQVKAGALAQQQSSDLFRAASGTQQGVPQGLGGGFGGIGGTPFLAQQLGGGKGLQEILAGDIQALSKNRNKTGEFGDVPGTVNDILGSLNPFGENFANPGKQVDVRREAASQAGPTPVLTAEIDDLNAAMTRGAVATGQSVSASYQFTTSQADIARAVSISKAAGDDLGAAIAAMGYIMVDAKGNVADFQSQLKSLTQAGIGKGIPEPAELGALALAQEQQRQREAAASIPALLSKQAYERPAFLAQQERQQQFQLQTQLPAQQALQNLTNPLQPVGTGIAAANAKEQKQITAYQQEAVDLQKQLNTGYEQGKQILLDTYKVPLQLINDIAATGQEIASTQAGIRNEQAAYQVAQYNFQLHIARRTLGDIGGLTGKNFGAGQSYLGSLEKQNLALSRQGQLLQFNLSQRQINFQTALAGFQTPGVTPEERQARVKEAQIEAGFAQKQLDISKQIFGNQVQIVDIQNLRQGADLAAQIGLLLQGRKVTIDTAQAEERLALLNKLQAQQVAKVGTYIQKVDTLVGKAFADINALETAAGKAMAGIAVQVLQQYALVIRGISTQLNAGANSGNYTEADRKKNASGAHASGIVGTTTGTTNMTIGEAGSETYAILRNPRSVMGALGGGGGPVAVTFGDVYVRSEDDIDSIVRKVSKALGRDAALKGLRSTG